MSETGIFKGVPMNEYRKWKGVSKSMFSSVLKSGLHLKRYFEKGESESQFMVFGNLVDTMLFEESLFAERYSFVPETYPSTVKNVTTNKPWNWNANYCKEWRDEKFAEHPDIKLISSDDFYRAGKIRESILRHPEASKWLEGAQYQVSMSWVDHETGLTCKGRPDALKEERIIDLKVTNDCHPRGFSRTMNNFLYHCQAAFYHDGYFAARDLPIPETIQIPFSFIAAEDQEPFDVVCYNIGEQSFDVGRMIYREALQRYLDIKETGEYCGYSNVAEEIEIPQYAINKMQFEGVMA